MPALVAPTSRVQDSFRTAMAEFQTEGRGGPDDQTMIGEEIRQFSPTWHDPTAFAVYIRILHTASLENTPRPPGRVPATTLWWVDGEEYLGRLAIRHRLNEFLRELGGHIGYDVRPSARRRGHATHMLRAARPIAQGLGIDRVLITCDVDNVGSRRVIEANGGEFEDQRGGKLRFWVPTKLDAIEITRVE
jgi:predicted acetyltransferase